MVKINDVVTKRIQKVLAEAGISGDEHVLIEQFKLSDMPEDAYLTEVALMRAEAEAEGMDCKYYCYGCGKKYDDPEEFIKCFQEHIKQFLGGLPIPTTKEHNERLRTRLSDPFGVKNNKKKR